MAAERLAAAPQVDALRFDAGSLSLNLVATVARRFAEPVERLTSVEHLRDWLAGVGLDVETVPTEDDLIRVRSLREHLDALFRSALAGARPPADAVAGINSAVACGVPRLSAARARFALASPASASAERALDPVMALIATDAIRILVGSDRRDLRVCAADDCRMLYLAHGRRARRWCSSDRCGNRSRVAAHRARSGQRQAKASGEEVS
jgi:predicted RNA-binding Zn ribbon-like protein